MGWARHWARQAWPYAALAALTLAAALPLLKAGVPCTDDGAFHLHRAVALGRLLADGHLFPRWSPDMAQGYGYPFFNFYAPLSSYGVAALHGLGLAYPAALTAAFVGALGLAATAAFWLGRRLWGPAAGLASAAVYLFSPYLAYDILYRGNLAETFAFVWPPLVLLGLHQALSPDEPRPRAGWLLAALSYAALILTHNVFALLASPLFAAFVALMAWRARLWRVAARGGLALVAGIALSAYFWLPALAERGLVHSDRLLVPPIFTWYTNFISLPELLAWPRPDDPLLINPSPARAIGLIPALLWLPALWAAVRKRDQHRGLVGLLALAAAGYGLMTLPVSTPVWEFIQPLELVQFPWRMLGPAALCVALLVGASVRVVASSLGEAFAARRSGQPHRVRPMLRPCLARALPAALVIAVVYFANLPWWYARYCPAPPTASVANLVQYERDSFTIGTTAKGEYLPRTAPGVPPATDLADALIAGEEPPRLSLPDGAGVIAVINAHDPQRAAFEVAVGRDVTAVYRQFFFPGWRVSVDGQPAGAHALGQGASGLADWPGDDNAGLIAFALPAGTHTVQVSFGLTPLRSAAAGISLAALAALAAYWMLQPRQALARGPALHGAHGAEPMKWAAAIIVGVCAALPLARVWIVDRMDTPLRRSAFDAATLPLSAPLGETPLAVDFAGGIRLHGYDLSSTVVPSGGALDAALYVSRWMAAEQRYWPAFRIEDAQGVTWHQAEQLPPRWHREPPPSALWPLDQYAQWARRVAVLPGTPPGEYALLMEIFDLRTLAIASSLDANGNNAAPRLALATVRVERPAEPVALQPARRVEAGFGPLTLLGADVDRTAANAGETVLVSLYWRSELATAEDWMAEISLTAAGTDRPGATYALPPVNGFGTRQWQPGDEWLGRHPLRLPADLPSGDYALTLSVPGQPGTASLGQLAVAAPERLFTAPAMAAQSGAAWEGVGVLAGFTLTQTGDALTLDLVWQPTATPSESYSVFVHLQAADGRVAAQSDGVPAGWTRPTTGWLPGEFVIDTHRLRLDDSTPPGEYALLVGLYLPGADRRVPVAGPGAQADDRALIARVTVR